MARLPTLISAPLRVSADLASASSWVLARYADVLRAVAGVGDHGGSAGRPGTAEPDQAGRAPAAVSPVPRVAAAPAPAPTVAEAVTAAAAAPAAPATPPPARKPPRKPAAKAEPHPGAGTPARPGGRISNPKAARKVRARSGSNRAGSSEH
jgi:hypothetical protein